MSASKRLPSHWSLAPSEVLVSCFTCRAYHLIFGIQGTCDAAPWIFLARVFPCKGRYANAHLQKALPGRSAVVRPECKGTQSPKPASTIPIHLLLFYQKLGQLIRDATLEWPLRELDRPIPAPPRYRTFRDHTAPVERILLVSCIPDHLGADEIELWLHDADHLGYKGLKIFDHGRSDPNSTSAAHGQGKQLFLIFGTPDEALTARGYWARKYVSMGGAQVRLDCQWLGQYRHDHPSIGAFTQNLGTPPGLLLSCCRSSDRSSPKALPSALNWSRTYLVPAATGLLWLPATRSSSSFRRSRMATVLPRNRSSQSGMSLQGSCLRPLMQSTASGRSNTAQPANDDAAEASEEEAEADDPESEDGDSSDAEGHNEEAAPAAAGCRRSRTRRPSNFASSYREEAVAGVPDWCEENLCGPACIDDAKGEGKIAELKQNVPEGQDPLQFISLRQWVLTDYRKSFDSSPASQRQPHLLSGSGAEVIAPCVAASSTLLRPNFADFCKRWTDQHSDFWRIDPQSGSVVFLLGDPRSTRVYIHCRCGQHRQLESLAVTPLPSVDRSLPAHAGILADFSD